MKLACPACGTPIAAQNINVQTMVAVCEQCDSVFSFDATDTDRKRRKVRQPARLHLDDTADRLTMRYRRVFNQDEQGFAIGNGFFTVLLPIILILTLAYNASIFVSLFFALWMLVSWYGQVALLLNRTSLTMDVDRLSVTCGPLPWPTSARNTAINRHDLGDVVCEETEDSRRVAAVNRYYHVRARLLDGQKHTLLQGIPQDYAFYIAQELNALTMDAPDLHDFFADDAALEDHDLEIPTDAQQRLASK